MTGNGFYRQCGVLALRLRAFMGSKRRIRRNSCEGKRQYATQTQAVAAMLSFRKKFHDPNLATYKCRFGNHWHFGHVWGRPQRPSRSK